MLRPCGGWKEPILIIHLSLVSLSPLVGGSVSIVIRGSVGGCVSIVIRGSGGRCVSLSTEEAGTVSISGAVDIIDTLGTLLKTTVLFVSSENI